MEVVDTGVEKLTCGDGRGVEDGGVAVDGGREVVDVEVAV